jgi:hypothetical protein
MLRHAWQAGAFNGLIPLGAGFYRLLSRPRITARLPKEFKEFNPRAPGYLIIIPHQMGGLCACFFAGIRPQVAIAP